MGTMLRVGKGSKVKPLHDWCLVEKVEDGERRSGGGVLLPESVREDAGWLGRVVAAGTGKWVDGELCDLQVEEDDLVIVGAFAYHEIRVGDRKLYFVREGELYARVTE